MQKCQPPASQCNRMSKNILRSEISRVHFRNLVCWVFWVKFPCSLTLIYSKLSTLGIQSCLGMLYTILKSIEPILPSLWHSGFAWLQQGL